MQCPAAAQVGELLLKTPAALYTRLMHYMLSYVGGKEGRLNFNRGASVESDIIGIGLLVVEPGHEQISRNVPTAEVYVLVRGKAIINFGIENEELGHLDGVYLPAGHTRSIRNHGTEPTYNVWVHEQP